MTRAWGSNAGERNIARIVYQQCEKYGEIYGLNAERGNRAAVNSGNPGADVSLFQISRAFCRDVIGQILSFCDFQHIVFQI
jgi:hypothetical protein